MPDGRRAAGRSFDAMTSPPICLDRADQALRPVTAVDDLTFDVRRRRRSPASSAPTAPARRTTLRMLLGLAQPDRRHRHRRRRAATPSSSDPAAHRRRGARGDHLPPGRTARNHLRDRRGGRRHRRERGSTRCSARSASPTRPTAGSAASRSACASGSASPARCSATRGCWSSTSRPTASTRRASAGCAASCAPTPREGRTVLVSSHLLAEVAADRRRRRDHRPRPAARAQGSLDELDARAGRHRRGPDHAGRRAARAGSPPCGIEAVRPRDDRLTDRGREPPETVGEVAALGGIPLSAMTTRASDLGVAVLRTHRDAHQESTHDHPARTPTAPQRAAKAGEPPVT